MNYKKFLLSPVQHQGTKCFRVTTPQGHTWAELFATVATAKKHVDAHCAERAALRQAYLIEQGRIDFNG